MFLLAAQKYIVIFYCISKILNQNSNTSLITTHFNKNFHCFCVLHKSLVQWGQMWLNREGAECSCLERANSDEQSMAAVSDIQHCYIQWINSNSVLGSSNELTEFIWLVRIFDGANNRGLSKTIILSTSQLGVSCRIKTSGPAVRLGGFFTESFIAEIKY